jgi:hypothetical protein
VPTTKRSANTAAVGQASHLADGAEVSTHRITSARQLLKAVPVLLGFHAEMSMVVLGLESSPSPKITVTVRYPLHDPRVSATASVEHAIQVLTRRTYTHVVAVGYGPDELVAPFIEQLRAQCGNHGVEPMELLRVEDTRYWSYLCSGSTCCLPEGTPFDPTPDPKLAEAVGVPGVLANREALTALVARDDAATMSMRRAMGKAKTRASELVEQAQRSRDPAIRRCPLAAAGIEALQAAIARYQQGDSISYAQAAWLLTCFLREMWVRDDAISRIQHDGQAANLRLWLRLLQLAPAGYVAPPATMVTFAAWTSGNGALANVALDRALGDDPNYSMARILRRLVDAGLNPEKSELFMTPDEVTQHYMTVAARGGRSRRRGK